MLPGVLVPWCAAIFETMATKTKKNALDWALAPAPESKDHVKIHGSF